MLNTLAGIIASSGGAVATSYESIATVTASGSPSTLSLTSIPQTYTHLQLRIYGGNIGYSGDMKFNSDSGANYASHRLTGDGSSVTAAARTSSNAIRFAGYSGLYLTSNIASACIMDILDYSNSNKYKTSRDINGYDLNGSGYIDFESGLWMSTSAITRIDLSMVTGTWTTGSKVDLYGIKG